MTIFSERLTTLRQDKKLDKADLANQLNVSLAEYESYEDGTSYPEKKLLLKIAKLLDTSTYYLTGNSDISSLSDKEQADIEYSSLDHAKSYDDQPMSDHDRQIIRTYLEELFAGKQH